jgi:Domain of unknown function (DUF1772)
VVVSALEFTATLSGALFAGAALYINVVEHPVRFALDARAAATQWASSYKRATWLQAPLALISLASGAAAWLLGSGFGWLVAALLVGAVVPFTFAVILPTNKKLLAPDRDVSSTETRDLLVRWGRLHAVRTALSLFGVIVYLWLLLET